MGRFYLLPKIHKRLMNVPGRPVISNCGTPAERILKFVDFHLQPIIKTFPHVIKDTTDFLCKLEELGDVPENAIVCIMDVVGLYLHIPHYEALKCLKEVIEEYIRKSEIGGNFNIGVDDLVDLAKFILENNCFEFEDNIYR